MCLNEMIADKTRDDNQGCQVEDSISSPNSPLQSSPDGMLRRIRWTEEPVKFSAGKPRARDSLVIVIINHQGSRLRLKDDK